jgi:restriction system protein
MADITRRRTGELLHHVFELLWDKPDGLPAKDILDAIPKSIKLTEYESGYYASTPNSPRFEKIVRFATIDLVHAGWLVKSKGRWYLTEEGRLAYKKYTDPEDFYKEAVRLYHEWKRTRPVKEGLVTDEQEIQKISLTVDEAEEKSWEQIQQYLQQVKPYEFQEFVADLLRAMGYHVSWVAPQGKDRGIDIIAYTEPLGASVPRIKVQVKHRDQPTAVEGLLIGNQVIGISFCQLHLTSDVFWEGAWDFSLE